jgi:hypothetical protein
MAKRNAAPSYDAILIPGGGVRADGALPRWVERRMERALELYQGEYIITLSAGTPFKPPPLDAAGFPIFEAIAGANYLVRRGIDPQKILPETCSYDTIGNAYFSRMIHVEPRRFHRLLVITSQFHLPRVEAVFRWVYGLDGGSYRLNFEATPDKGIEPVALAARQEKEGRSLAGLPALQSKLQTVAQLHHWLFTTHGAYAVGALPPHTEAGNALATY